MDITMITGNLGKDPEVKSYGSEGRTMTKFTVGVRRRRGNETKWFNVTAFGKLGENAAKYLHKGSKVNVVGEVDCHGYKNNLEEITASLDLTATDIDFLDTKGSGQTAQPEPMTPVDPADMPF